MSDKKFTNPNINDNKGYKGSLGMKKPMKINDLRLKNKSKPYLIGPNVMDIKNNNIVYPTCSMSSNIEPMSDSNSKSIGMQNFKKADFDYDSETKSVTLPVLTNNSNLVKDNKSTNPQKGRDKYRLVHPGSSKPGVSKQKGSTNSNNFNNLSNIDNFNNFTGTTNTPNSSNGRQENNSNSNNNNINITNINNNNNANSSTNLHSPPSYMNYTSNSYIKSKLNNNTHSINTNNNSSNNNLTNNSFNNQVNRPRENQKQTFSYGQVSNNHSFYTKPKSVNKVDFNVSSTEYNKMNTGFSNSKIKSNKISNKSLNLNIPNDSKVMTIQSNINYNLNLQNFKMASLGTTNVNVTQSPVLGTNISSTSNYNIEEKEKKQSQMKININKIKDDRKFSILDIPSGISQMVKSDASKLAMQQGQSIHHNNNSNNSNNSISNSVHNQNLNLSQNQNQNRRIEEELFKEENYNPQSNANELYYKETTEYNDSKECRDDIQKINFNKNDVYDFFWINNNPEKERYAQQMRNPNFINNNSANFNNYSNLNKDDQIRIMNSHSSSYMHGSSNTGITGQYGYNTRSDVLKDSSYNNYNNNYNTSNIVNQNHSNNNRNHYLYTNYSNIPHGHGNNNFIVNTSASGFSNNAIPHFLLNNSTMQSNNINNDESQLYQSLVSDIQQGKRSTQKAKKDFSLLKNKTLKAFFIMLESEMLTPNARLKLVTQVKPIYDACKDSLLKDYTYGLIKSVKQLDEKYCENIRFKLRDEAVNWTFKPTCTTQLSLNHLSKKFDQKLCLLRPKHKEIEAIFKLILTLFNVNESYSSEHTLLTVYSKFKINSLSKLLN
jgi:hypothetical protein